MKNQLLPVIILTTFLSLIFCIGCISTPQCISPPQRTSPPQSQYDKNMETVKGIVEEYNKTHFYNGTEMFGCAQMSEDVWDMVGTQGINAKIVLGNLQKNVSTIEDINHAWVIAEVTPDRWVAMETTAGYLSCPDPNYCAVNNPRYFMGWDFPSPKEMQDFLKTGRSPDYMQGNL